MAVAKEHALGLQGVRSLDGASHRGGGVGQEAGVKSKLAPVDDSDPPPSVALVGPLFCSEPRRGRPALKPPGSIPPHRATLAAAILVRISATSALFLTEKPFVARLFARLSATCRARRGGTDSGGPREPGPPRGSDLWKGLILTRLGATCASRRNSFWGSEGVWASPGVRPTGGGGHNHDGGGRQKEVNLPLDAPFQSLLY